MNLLATLPDALSVLGSLSMILILLMGVVFGILLGALPGFGAAQSLALLFPLTFAMTTDQSMIFMLAIYSAAEYGGSIPAILIRTPGTPGSSVTAIDGYAMARKGLATKALRISLYSGCIGGIVSTLIFVMMGTSLAYIGLQFGPGEMFALGVFGLSIIGSFFGKDAARGFVATGIGLLLATVGSSGFGGLRFVFGQDFLMDGIPLVVVVIGLLAGPEAFQLLVDDRRLFSSAESVRSNQSSRELNRITRADLRRLWPTWVRGSLIGTGMGILPGAGGAVGALIAYSEEKRWCKRGEEFGTGIEEAVAAPESANNAVVAGALVPSLALAIPGSGAAAILIGLLVSKGVAPGPLLFQNEPALIMTIFLGLIVINLGLLVLGLIGSRPVGLIASIPRRILGPFVMLLIVVGTYAYGNYMGDVYMMFALAAFAYVLQKIEIPVVPVVLAFVMGPIIEQNLNRALTIHAGDLSVVLSRPITVTILVLAVLSVAGSIYSQIRRERSTLAGEAKGAGGSPG